MFLDDKRTCTDTIAKRARHKIYNNRRWRKVRAFKFKSNPLCEQCLLKGRVTEAQLIHHIIPIDVDPNLAYEYDNLMSLCHNCHGEVHKNLHQTTTKAIRESKKV